MKRDMTLIRSILQWMESQEHGYVEGSPQIENYSPEEIGYHCYLIHQAGLATGNEMTSMGDSSPSSLLLSLTWAGHDFLDAARDDTLWNKANEHIFKPGISFTFGLLLEWLKLEAKQKLGLP